MVDLHRQEAGEGIADPLLVERIGFFLLGAVVAGQVEAFAALAFQVGIGRRGAKAAEIGREVAMEDHQRKVRFRVLVEIARHQHVRGQIDVAAPEL